MVLDELLSFKDANVHIVGLSGTEGTAVLRLLDRLGFSKITVHNRETGERFDAAFKRSHVGIPVKERLKLLAWVKGLPIEWQVGDAYLSDMSNADLVFLSQGWYLYKENHEAVAALRQRGVRISSMTELYFDLAPCPIIGVTGSNGKSTTTLVIDQILADSNVKNHFAGNDRHNVQVLHELQDFSHDDVLLLEISNRQLIDLEKSPHIAVITNLTPDHISEHGSFDSYVETKAKIIKNQTESDYAILNYDDPLCRELALQSRSQVYFFSVKDDEIERGAFVRGGRLYLADKDEVVSICPRSAIKVPGEHNLANILAASLAARLAGVEVSAISRGIRSFGGKSLRIEWVARIDGVDYYNDVKSTTPHAAIAAIRSFEGPIALIAGGEDKGLDYGDLAREATKNVRCIELLPGSGSEKIAAAISELKGAGGVPVINRCSSLEEAVNHASSICEAGSTVLLSPACASFYSLYMQSPNRGFGSIVKGLKGGS